jgi:transposase
MKQHSEDFKIAAVGYYLTHSFEETSIVFNCSKRSLIRWKNKYLNNNLHRKIRISNFYKINEERIKFIIERVENNKLITLRELKAEIENKFRDLTISRQPISRILMNNISKKRVRHGHFPLLRRNIVTDKKFELSSFYKEIKRYPIDKIISIDETSLKPYMYRKYGYSIKGTRCIESTSNNKFFTKHTFIGAITNSKLLDYKLYEKDAMNTDRLLLFLSDLITANKLKGHLFILDNAKFHKNDSIIKLINQDNKVLYTVPYNPSTNPIENWFSQFKYWLSNSKMRTFTQLENDVNDVISSKISPTNYSNYFNYAYAKEKFTKNILH